MMLHKSKNSRVTASNGMEKLLLEKINAKVERSKWALSVLLTNEILLSSFLISLICFIARACDEIFG